MIQVVRGYCMGAADLVPGVSGGTIALVFGIYEQLIAEVSGGAAALGHLVRGDLSGFWRGLRRVDWLFLVPLLVGIGLAVVTLASFLDHHLEERPEVMSAIFGGLVAASVVVAWNKLRTRDGLRLLLVVVTAAAAFWFLGLRSEAATDPATIWMFGAGALAICAMILPGVSGSFILLMLGVYDYVLDAVNDRDLAVMVVFAAGAVVGLALFSTLLNWLLEHHHDTVVAVLIGIMLGSLRVLWPWPADEEGIDEVALGAPETDTLVPVMVGAAVAFAVVMVIATVGERKAA